MCNMETKERIIQRIKSDKKALAIENIWYNFFKPISDEFKVGDDVRIIYSIKGNFNNAKSIEIIKSEIKSIVDKEDLPVQTKNTALLSACNIICKEIEKGTKYDPKELTNKIQKLSEDFIKAYRNL